MSHEIDWRAVGDESKSGDCSVFRFGSFLSNPMDQTIVVIDGGFRDNGEDLVKFIKSVYGSDKVDLVISTHPDNDHLSGLNVVLDELKVGELWMHKPWERQDDIRTFVTEGRITKREFSEAVRKSLTGAKDLANLADKKGIPIYEPFQGRQAYDGILTILGPTEDFYNETLADVGTNSGLTTIGGVIKNGVMELVEKALIWIDETLEVELLTEPDENATSPRNSSSVISLLRLDGKAFMFTADAGVSALNHAADYADALGFSIVSNVDCIQVPHHGSKRNVGPLVLDRLFGTKPLEGEDDLNKWAIVSAAKKGSPKHPNGRVINALNRRGTKVAVTKGACFTFRSKDVPVREGSIDVIPVPFQSRYQDNE